MRMSGPGSRASIHTPVLAITANKTLDASHHVVLVTTGSSAITVTLPAAANHTGRIYRIFKVDSGNGTVVVDGNSSETIEGATTFTLGSQYAMAAIVSNGTLWFKLDAGTSNLVATDGAPDPAVEVNATGQVGVGVTPPDTNAQLFVEGAIALDEISAPTATANYGKVWTQTDNNLYFQDGAGTNAAVIKGGIHTIFVPAGAMRPTKSNGCAALTDVETTSGRPDMTVLDFDDGSDEHAQFQIAFPKSWNGGTITFQVYWCSTATDTDGVSWGLQGVSVADNATIDVAYGTAVVVDDVNQGAAEEMLVSPTSGAVTIASAAVDTMTFFRIFRDVSDSNDVATEDARLIGVKLFYTVDSGNDA